MLHGGIFFFDEACTEGMRIGSDGSVGREAAFTASIKKEVGGGVNWITL